MTFDKFTIKAQEPWRRVSYLRSLMILDVLYFLDCLACLSPFAAHVISIMHRGLSRQDNKKLSPYFFA